MRSIRIRKGVREARRTLFEAGRLLRIWPMATLLLGIVLAVLPALVKAFLMIRAQASLLEEWSLWIEARMSGRNPAGDLSSLTQATLQASGSMGLGVRLLDLSRSLMLLPVLYSSLALLYNGFIHSRQRAGLKAARMAVTNVRSLVVVALICMVAEWFVQMVPSLASGLLSLLAGLLSWIPLLGAVAEVVSVVLSILLYTLTDFAVIVIFCYVWICAVCEGVSGFGALVRSWQLTRNATHETIFSLLALLLLRAMAIAVAALLWLFIGRPQGMALTSLLYITYAISALHPVFMAAAASSLYQRRPVTRDPQPGQFSSDSSDLNRMKRANID
ncbi:hypothetical protein LJC74_00430 [Eubacteriales bacterium OttesenSCG-928-A19]|nr:hypothetical protein [Eubacteriales bacterium OttesenSCG-928-A19]